MMANAVRTARPRPPAASGLAVALGHGVRLAKTPFAEHFVMFFVTPCRPLRSFAPGLLRISELRI